LALDTKIPSVFELASSEATKEVAPYIVMYVGLGLLFSALVLVLAVWFMEPRGPP
jgi:hypothetical protein